MQVGSFFSPRSIYVDRLFFLVSLHYGETFPWHLLISWLMFKSTTTLVSTKSNGLCFSLPLSGWNTLVYAERNMEWLTEHCRNGEQEQVMTYLSRKPGCSSAYVEWRFDFSESGRCFTQVLYCPAVFGHFLDPPGNHPRGAIFPTVD